MWGFLAVCDKVLVEDCQGTHNITEGSTNHGGLSGRDMKVLAIDLQEVFNKDYLNYGMRSMAYLGERIDKLGVPVVKLFVVMLFM